MTWTLELGVKYVAVQKKVSKQASNEPCPIYVLSPFHVSN